MTIRTLRYLFAFPSAVVLVVGFHIQIAASPSPVELLALLMIGFWMVIGIGCAVHDVSCKRKLQIFLMGSAHVNALVALVVLWWTVGNTIRASPGFTYEVSERVYATCYYFRNSWLTLWTFSCFLAGLGFVFSPIVVGILRVIDPFRRTGSLVLGLDESYSPKSERADAIEPIHGESWTPYTPPLSVAPREAESLGENLPPSLAVQLPSPIEWIPFVLLYVALVTAAPFVIPFLINGLAPVVAAITAFFYWKKRADFWDLGTRSNVSIAPSALTREGKIRRI